MSLAATKATTGLLGLTFHQREPVLTIISCSRGIITKITVLKMAIPAKKVHVEQAPDGFLPLVTWLKSWAIK